MKAHRDNFTAISPPLYNIHIDGTFARIAGDSAGSYAELFPYVRELAALGLEVHPLIAGYGYPAISAYPLALTCAPVR